MTELQMGLIGLGAVAVIGVVGYNKWQEFRQCKQAAKLLQSTHPDVLLDTVAPPALPDDVQPVSAEPATAVVSEQSERIEPVLYLDPLPEEALTEAAAEVSASLPEGSLPQRAAARLTEMPAASMPSAAVTEDKRYLSPLVDFIGVIDAVEPVSAARILDAQREALARVRKPVNWIGFNEQSAEWESLVPESGAAYRHIHAGLQLVDRQGAANENDLAIFSAAIQDLAELFSGFAELPARQAALESAARLDQFCAGVDIQIGINVVSQGQAFPGTKLRALAEAAGMSLDAAGRFVRRDDDGNVLYTLFNQDESGFSAEAMKTLSAQGLTFLLDVPCVPHAERIFNQMVDLARRFADVLHGVLVDDNRRPLSEAALEPIRKQIAQYQTALAAQQLPPGSALTRRLFS